MGGSPSGGGGGGDSGGGVVDLGPYLYNLVASGNWEQLLFGDLSFIFNSFAGRPREEATIQVAQRMGRSKNPAGLILSAEWLRGLLDFGIVISTSDPGEISILDAFNKQFTSNLQAQGVSLARARQILVNGYSRDAQAGAPLEPELTSPLAQGLTVLGPQIFLDQYQVGLDTAARLNIATQNVQRFAERYAMRHVSLLNITKLVVGTIPTPTPPPGQPPGPPPIIPPFPPPIVPPQGGGDGDELTDCCDETQTALGNILNAIEGLGSNQAPTDPNCCANVVAAINSVAAALATLAPVSPSPPGGAPVDLTGVIAELTAIATAISAAPPSQPIDLTQVVNALEAAANTVAKAITDNEANWTKWMETLPPRTARTQSLIQHIADLGFLDPELLQLATQ